LRDLRSARTIEESDGLVVNCAGERWKVGADPSEVEFSVKLGAAQGMKGAGHRW